jgi:hypothetical protein
MNARRATWLAWSLWSIHVALVGGIAWLVSQVGDFKTLWLMLASSVAPTIGAVVAARRWENPIGWMLVATGVLSAVSVLVLEYAELALIVQPGMWPGGVAAGWLGSWMYDPAQGLLAFVGLIFPTGRLLSRNWRWVAVALAGGLALHTVLTALEPGNLKMGSYLLPADNPLGVDWLGPVLAKLGVVFLIVPFLFALPSIVAVVLRFRRSRGVERQQMKWLVYAALAFPILIWLTNQGVRVPDELKPLFPSGLLFGLAVSIVPSAIGLAVLRYRLYDIDLIIRRTLVYGGLTALLALLYWTSVVVLQQMLRPLTQGSDLAIVGSTLAVAALFQPLRHRIQQMVDRRFYRQRYDAGRTLDAFSSRLRSEVDLDNLGAELLAVVDQTMQPQRLSLWLRPPADRRR